MKRLFSIFSILILLSVTHVMAQSNYYGVDQPFQSKWSLGLKIGAPVVLGEVDNELSGIYEIGLSVQKSLIRALDLRLQMHAGRARGLDKTPSVGFKNNTALNSYYDTTGGQVFYNFSSQYFDGSLQLKLNLNRIFSAEGGEAWDLYVFGGGGMMMYYTTVDALDAQSMPYPYDEITETNEQTVRSLLIGMLDGTFETRADQDVVNKNGIGNYALVPHFTTGGGFRIKLSQNWAVGLEGRYNFTGDNLIDGQRWDAANVEITKGDNYVSGSIMFDYTFGKE